MQNIIIGLSAALLVFSFTWYTSKQLWLSLVLAVLFGLLARDWGHRLVRFGPGKGALERMIMKQAWTSGGYLTPEDLSGLGVSKERAEDLLQDMQARGLCRREDTGYRFYH